MGGAVSSGRDNNELIDNLMGGNYIRSTSVERVFRALDRADYMTPESRDQAYKDLAWRNGALHLSSPCIYSEVMEGLELKPGLSFLNVGSGTGYLSTLAGLILGSGGISHGVEVHSSVVDYANKKLGLFIANSPSLDEFDFCEPRFYVGNGLSLTPQQQPYDRVYCGAACPDEYENYFKQLIKVGGVLVMPLNDTLLQVRRVAADQWVSRSLLTVSFARLRLPPKDQRLDYVKLEEQSPPRLQVVARGAVRAGMRRGVLRRHPELGAPAPRRAAPPACPRRICIPIEPGGAVEGLDILHDLDAETGANEMNALLSLVIRMDQNRVAGAIRFDGVDSSSDSDSHSDDSSDEGRPRRNRADRDAGESTERRPRRRSGPEGRSAPDRDEGRGSARASKSGSVPTRPDRRSSRNGSRSDRSGSGSASKDRSARESARPNSDDSANSRSRRGRRAPDDDKSTRPDKCRRVVPPGRLWAFEFQATERTPQPTTSSGAGGGSDTSTAPSAPTSTAASTPSSDSGDKTGRDPQDRTDRRSGGRSTKSRRGSSGRKHSTIMSSEVELCFRGGKLQGLLPGPSGARMEWEESQTETEAKAAGDEAQAEGAEGSESKAKRQKLDSGIGENSASGSSPDKSKAEETDTDDRPTDSVTDDANHSPECNAAYRRRLHKRSRCETRTSSSSAEEGGAGGAGAGGGASGAGGGASGAGGGASGAGGGARRRAARRARGPDARRVRLSIVMKRAIKELPLPYPLKKYVNLGRCFEF